MVREEIESRVKYKCRLWENEAQASATFSVSKGNRSPITGVSRSARRRLRRLCRRRRFLPMTTRLCHRSPPPLDLEILPPVASAAAPVFETPPPVAAASSPVKGKVLMEETKAAGTLDKVKELEERIKMLEDEKYEILKGRNETHQLKSTATKDLETELKKMLNPDLEQSGKDPSSLDRTVLVFRVPPHASEVDITTTFSCCGDIEFVEMESGYQCQIANVTYKNADGAERAIRLKRTKVCDVDVKVSASRYARDEDCEAWDKEMEAARKPEPSAEEVKQLLKRMREKALKKYRELAKLYGKDVKAERNDGVVEVVCSKPSEGTKKKARKHRKRRGGKVDVSSAPGAEAADSTPLRDEDAA